MSVVHAIRISEALPDEILVLPTNDDDGIWPWKFLQVRVIERVITPEKAARYRQEIEEDPEFSEAMTRVFGTPPPEGYPPITEPFSIWWIKCPELDIDTNDPDDLILVLRH